MRQGRLTMFAARTARGREMPLANHRGPSPRVLRRVFLVCLILGLVWQAPSWLLNSPAQSLTGQRLHLANAAGTIWSGSASLVCRVEAHARPCGDLAWRIDWPALFLGQLALNIRSSHSGESLRLSLSPSGWRLDHAALSLPAELLGALDGKIAALGLKGHFQVSGNGLSKTEGALLIHWRRAGTRLVPDLVLGDHRLRLVAHDNGVDLQLDTLRGPLTLAGGGRLADDGSLRLKVDVQITGEETRLSPLLAMIGQTTGPGRFQLSFPAS